MRGELLLRDSSPIIVTLKLHTVSSRPISRVKFLSFVTCSYVLNNFFFASELLTALMMEAVSTSEALEN
jgi:hypothetical protein